MFGEAEPAYVPKPSVVTRTIETFLPTIALAIRSITDGNFLLPSLDREVNFLIPSAIIVSASFVNPTKPS